MRLFPLPKQLYQSNFFGNADKQNFSTRLRLLSILDYGYYRHCSLAFRTDKRIDLLSGVDGGITATYRIPNYPHISLGWDNNQRFQEFRPGIVKNNTPAAIRDALAPGSLS